MSKFFLQGFLHFTQAPAHLVVLFGFGLLLGQQGWRALRFGLPVFLAAMTGGLLLAGVLTAGTKHDVTLLIIAVVVGALLAIKMELPILATALLTAVTSVLIGMDSTPSLFPGIRAMNVYAAFAGTVAGDALAVLFLALPALLLRQFANGIILRVLGSWVVASALMVLALMFVPR